MAFIGFARKRCWPRLLKMQIFQTHPKANYEFLIKYRGLKLVWMHFSCILMQSSGARLVWLFISLLTMLIALSATFIHEYWISWNKFSIYWGFPWVLLFRKEKQRIFQLYQLIGRDQIKRWQNISGFFLQIFAISRFDLAKLQNSAWFVKKFWT